MKSRAFLILAALALGGAAALGAKAPVEVNANAITEDLLPPALSEFGFFADPARQVPSQGVIPYRLNTPLYSDGAEKLRFAYVPPGQKARGNGEGLIDFPAGTALIKTFKFNGRLIETRVMLHRAGGWLALPYRWNESQTDAQLVVAGARMPVTTPDGEEISYRIPNKNQCKECHGLDGAVIPLGPKARNLSAEWLAGMVTDGRLDAMPQVHDTMPLWEARGEGDVAASARAYLDVNCAHCHRPGATASNSGLDLRWEQDDPHSYGVFKRPVAAGRGAGGLEFSIVPGEPDQSILLHRMNSIEPGVAMPELGKGTIDHDGVAIVRQWIAEMRQ
ncbi:MAG: hypothetical protein A3J40_08945 [Erythrobacter sp. RIFCSPHIGHO2_12_FULL_63_10]|nr:MAG: hypothetical protein A3J40_08945 [Erythrobacter sp. RIFCSPHIGHO2_12_FULL_63_10]